MDSKNIQILSYQRQGGFPDDEALPNRQSSSVTNDRNQKTTEEDKSHDLYKDDQQQATITTEMHETDQAKTKNVFLENYCPNETEAHRTMTENKTETSQNNGAKYRTEWSTSDGSGAYKNETCLTNTGELERQIQLQQGALHKRHSSPVANDPIHKTTEETKGHDLCINDHKQATITTEMHATDQPKIQDVFTENHYLKQNETQQKAKGSEVETSHKKAEISGAKDRMKLSNSDGSCANQNETCQAKTEDLEMQTELQQTVYIDDQQPATITTEMHETDQPQTKYAFTDSYYAKQNETKQVARGNQEETRQRSAEINPAKDRTKWFNSEESGGNQDETCQANIEEVEKQTQLPQADQGLSSYDAETQTLQKCLRFYFYHSIKYHHNHHNRHGRRCSVHIFNFLLMLLQIAKIICITCLMYQFGKERGNFNNIVTRGQLAMKNLLLKDWDPSLETPPYPPSHGKFAAYDSKTLQDKINYAVENFYSLMEDSIGLYEPLKQGSVTAQIKYVKFKEENVQGFFTETKTFKVHVKNHTDPATNQTRYVYDVLDDLKHNNFTEPMKRLLRLTLSFTTESVRVFTDEANALCLIIHGKIVFADPEKNGQMEVKLETDSKRILCKRLGYDVADKTEYLVEDQVTLAVLGLSSLSLVFSLFCFSYGLYICWETVKYMKKNYVRYFEPERYPNDVEDGARRDLPYSEYMKFFKLWDIMVIVADSVMIAGCFDLRSKKIDPDDAWTVQSLDISTVYLGCGCIGGWFALLRYFKFNYKFHILFNTIYASILDVLAYLFCVTVLFLGYMFFGYTVFGPYHIKFESLHSSAETLISLVNGDEVYATFALIEKDQTGGGDLIPVIFRIYIASFIAIFTIIVLNLLIALFNNAYDSIKKHYENQDSEEDGPLQAALKQLLLSEDNEGKQLREIFLDLMKKDQRTLSHTSKQAALKTQMERIVMLSKSKDKFVFVKPKTIKAFIDDEQAHRSCCELLCLCHNKEKNLTC